MPIYEFHCKSCNNSFELLLPINYKCKIKCDICKKIATKLISNNVNAIFKGNGFYETDYKKKS